jgi:hypothetical protein
MPDARTPGRPDARDDHDGVIRSTEVFAVRTTDSGRPWPSQARWILVEGPPRDRPIA